MLKSRLKEYGLVTPISTDSEGHFLSHLLSANHKQRVKRDVPAGSEPAGERLFFNITAFGKEFHPACSMAGAGCDSRTLLVFSQHIVEDVEELVSVVLLEDQSRTETDGLFSTAAQENT